MSQPNKPRERKIGTKQSEKKPLIDPRYKSFIYTIGFIVIIAIFFIVNNTRSEPEQGPYPPDYNMTEAASDPFQGKTAADFSLRTPDGKQLKLSDLKGKVVLLDFWATWCPPCRKGIPDLVELKKKYGSKGFEVVGISLDRDNTIADVVPFMKNYKINYPVVYGDAAVIGNYGNISSIPTSFLIDRSGKIVSSHEGLMQKTVYEQEIEKVL